uniref:Uncharacterized protein n=1 Tax=Anopheles merus TaxID=30066 RepID=A0A182VFE4_ANOME
MTDVGHLRKREHVRDFLSHGLSSNSGLGDTIRTDKLRRFEVSLCWISDQVLHPQGTIIVQWHHRPAAAASMRSVLDMGLLLPIAQHEAQQRPRKGKGDSLHSLRRCTGSKLLYDTINVAVFMVVFFAEHAHVYGGPRVTTLSISRILNSAGMMV